MSREFARFIGILRNARIMRWFVLLVILASAIEGGTFTHAQTVEAATTLTIKPTADAYVDSSTPSTNYGTRTTLRVDGSPTVRSYLRFSITGVSGTVTLAKLRIYPNSSSGYSVSVSPVSNTTWGETTITYSNAPAFGSVVASSGAVSAGVWKEIDITRLVKGNGTISLGLATAGSTAISLASRESGANAPQLVLSYTQTTPTGSPTLRPSATPTRGLTPSPSITPTPAPQTIYAAGDIAKCFGGTPSPTSGAFITSDMLLNTSGPIFTLGDNTNDSGVLTDYTNCFAPSWGRLKSRLRPAMGNHEILNNGEAYFTYFSGKTGTWGHYSLNLGAWHIVVLNAECGIGSQGCGAGSIQETWLRADLAKNTQKCILAIWHQPLFTSGTQSTTPSMVSFWRALYDYKADVILNGHNHIYERFGLQNPDGVATADGIREFVVGTGGASLDPSTKAMAANEIVRTAAAYGYLKLTLRSQSYDWSFVPQPGKTVSDSGSTACH